jgi:hypothetical protein
MSNMPSQRGGAGGPGSMSQGSSGMNKPIGTSASSAASEIGSAVRQGADEMKQQAGGLAESAKDLASQASDKLMNTMEQQKAAGADFVSGMAGAMRRAANEFGDVPQAAQYIRFAADRIDNVSDAFKRRDLNQLVSDVQDFARRQPTAFLGAAVLAGFAVIRFLKSSTATTGMSSSAGHQSHAGQGYGSTYQPMGGHSIASSSPNWSSPRNTGMS